MDELAKRALKKGNIEMQINISKAEVKSIIWGKNNQMWQERWDSEEKRETSISDSEECQSK